MKIFSGTTAFLQFGLATSVSAIALCSAAPAFADDTAPAADTSSTKDIIVTAQFRSQKLQDTPLAITAINAQLLDSRSQTDIAQIAAQAPNVSLNPAGGAYGSSMSAYIRGIGQADFNPAYEPGVGMYIDDVYYATLTGSVFDLLDLDRVEVLRGPQGTLTGRNSIGGAIKLFSKAPNGEDSGSVEAVYGSRNRVDLRATANFKLTDGLYARISGVYKRQDGYVNQVDYGCANPGNAQGIAANPSTPANCVMSKLGGVNYSGLRGALRYNPNDKLDWTVIGDYSYESRPNAAEVLTNVGSQLFGPAVPANYICGRFCTYANFTAPAGGQAGAPYSTPNNTMFTGWGVSSNLKYTVNDSFNLQAITAYRKYHETFGTDDDFTPSQTDIGQGYNDLKFHFFSQEARLNGKLGDKVEFTLGGFYSSQQSVYFTRQDIRYLSPLYSAIFGPGGAPWAPGQPYYLQFQGNDPINAHSAAGFGTVFYRPTSQLTFTGGLRYSSEHKDYTFVREDWNGATLSGFSSGVLGALNGLKSVYDGHKLDWRLSAEYRFNPEVMIYADASTGFKGGGTSARPFTPAQALNGAFKPETVTSYELGTKTDLLDRRLRVDLAAFYMTRSNIQLPLGDCSSLDGFAAGTDPNPCGAVQNAGSGHEYGFEGEVTASPVPGLDIDAALSYIGGKWTYISPAVGSSVLITDPIVTPAWKWSIGAQYKADLGKSGSLTPRIDGSYTSKSDIGHTFTGAAVEYLPSVFLANARLTWKNAGQNLSISMEVTNVFNKYYTPANFESLWGTAGTIYAEVGRPREWALHVKKNF